MATKRRRTSRATRRKKPAHGNVRSSNYEVVEMSPGRSTDGRTLYAGQSASRARATFEDFEGGAMVLKNGRVIDERRPSREEAYGLGYMQGRGAS